MRLIVTAFAFTAVLVLGLLQVQSLKPSVGTVGRTLRPGTRRTGRS